MLPGGGALKSMQRAAAVKPNSQWDRRDSAGLSHRRFRNVCDQPRLGFFKGSILSPSARAVVDVRGRDSLFQLGSDVHIVRPCERLAQCRQDLAFGDLIIRDPIA
jgi:hypothetical protein